MKTEDKSKNYSRDVSNKKEMFFSYFEEKRK